MRLRRATQDFHSPSASCVSLPRLFGTLSTGFGRIVSIFWERLQSRCHLLRLFRLWPGRALGTQDPCMFRRAVSRVTSVSARHPACAHQCKTAGLALAPGETFRWMPATGLSSLLRRPGRRYKVDTPALLLRTLGHPARMILSGPDLRARPDAGSNAR